MALFGATAVKELFMDLHQLFTTEVVGDERAVDVEVFEVQGETPIPLLLFLDDAEEPKRRGARAVERQNLGCFLGFRRFAVLVKHRPLLERGVPVV